MWLIEPPTPAQEAPIYIAATANASESKKKERVLGICSTQGVAEENKVYPSQSYGAEIFNANFYMKRYEHKPDFFGDGSRTTMTVLRQPAHGKLQFVQGFNTVGGYAVPIPSAPIDSSNKSFNAKDLIIQYIPEIGYDEMDSYAVEFKQNGVKVKVKYFVMVNSVLALPEKYCEIAPGRFRKGGEWKISLLPSQATDDLDSWLRATSLQATLSNAVSAVRGFRAAG